MKNVNRVNEIKYDNLTQEEYSFDEIAELLGTSKGRIYYNVNKYRIPSRRTRGRIFIAKDAVIYLMKCINQHIDNSIFHKSSNMYPSRRRLGRYKDYYRTQEVLYILGIDESELSSLISSGVFEFVPFSKKGTKRGGFAIEKVRAYAKLVGKNQYI